MAFIADPSLSEVYNFGNNANIVVVNGRPVQLNKSSVDSTDTFVVNVTGGTGRAAVLSGAPVMVGPSSAVANGNLDVAVDGGGATFVATAYGTGNSANFRGRSARGTLALPTASQTGDLLSSFSARGYGATGFSSSAAGRYGIYASENWTDLAQGTSIQLETTTNGTTTRSVRTIITNDGRFVIGASESSSVPALKASGTTLQVRLGDDSAFSALTGTILTGNTSVIAGTASTGTLSGTAVTGSGAFTVQATAATLTLTATGANPIQFATNGVNSWQISSAGNLIANADNTNDVGASGATRPRTGYFGTSLIIAGANTINGTSVVGSGAMSVQATSATLTLTATGANPVQFSTNGANQWNISGAGHILANTDNTNDIGASGATRPRTGYFGTSLVVDTTSTLTGTSLTGAGAFGVQATSATLTLTATGANVIQFATNGANQWNVSGAGHILANTDNTNDIGASGATRPRTGYFGTSIVVDATSTLNGTSLTGAGAFTVQATSAILNLTATGSNAIQFNTNGSLVGSFTSAGALSLVNKISNYNNIATQGWGVPAIYAYNRLTAQTATGTITTYTVGASDGSFRVGGNLNITSAAGTNMNFQVSYTDENNNPATANLLGHFGGGTGFTNAFNNTGTIEFVPITLRAKAGTTITMQTGGTAGTVSFSAEAFIEQMA